MFVYCRYADFCESLGSFKDRVNKNKNQDTHAKDNLHLHHKTLIMRLQYHDVHLQHTLQEIPQRSHKVEYSVYEPRDLCCAIIQLCTLFWLCGNMKNEPAAILRKSATTCLRMWHTVVQVFRNNQPLFWTGDWLLLYFSLTTSSRMTGTLFIHTICKTNDLSFKAWNSTVQIELLLEYWWNLIWRSFSKMYSLKLTSNLFYLLESNPKVGLFGFLGF